MKLKKLAVAGLTVALSLTLVGIVSAESASNYSSESGCSGADYYWYGQTETCYKTQNAKLTAQVSYLTQRVTELMNKLEEQQGETEQPATDGNIPAECEGVTFNRALKISVTGQDVKCLQVMLNRDLEKPIAESGPGSPGNETSYFGPKTKAGVVRFQEKYRARVLVPLGLSQGTGYFGQRTRSRMRARLNELGWEQKRKQEQEQEEEQEKEQSEDLTYCETDSDCTLVNENCCGCANGGSKKCINKDYQQSWKSELNCEGKKPIACPTVYLCDSLPSGCKCVNNTCQATK